MAKARRAEGAIAPGSALSRSVSRQQVRDGDVLVEGFPVQAKATQLDLIALR
jgi:hypothetical protein